ncbi:hypothetical protein BKA25_001917 [Actinoalloteichus hymeniacidonis]|uniref:Uncharacterized protein n=1 Tax=Actinoalloteichus hymeniacidonis TaxID=340345 RepID=A0AAC9HSH2_9PSEU|nr:hypothetical protein TL08_17655 [Actinoalloteichus hymeniacidonis]MBB5907601.1 hypothetical protein [Actinoalloteichus hymeniacidonis]
MGYRLRYEIPSGPADRRPSRHSPPAWMVFGSSDLDGAMLYRIDAAPFAIDGRDLPGADLRLGVRRQVRNGARRRIGALLDRIVRTGSGAVSASRAGRQSDPSASQPARSQTPLVTQP